MVSTTDTTEKLGITLPKSILQKVDTMRGNVPRSTFIRSAVEGQKKMVIAENATNFMPLLGTVGFGGITDSE